MLVLPYSVKVDSSSTLKIYNQNNVLMNSVQSLSPSNQVQLTVTNMFSSGLSAGSSTTLIVNNIINPGYVSTSPQGIQVVTMTSQSY